MDRFLVQSLEAMAEAVRSASELDTIEIESAEQIAWQITDTGWRLCGERGGVHLDGPAGARVRIVCNRAAYLLVGDNGHSSIQQAIDAACGGEVILVAPGTYFEGRAFTSAELGHPDVPAGEYGLVLNKAVTLQGVAEDGSPIVDRDEVSAAVLVKCGKTPRASFVVTSPDVVIRGLGFVPAGSRGEPDAGDRAARVFEVFRDPFRLVASVIEQSGSVRTASALYFHDCANDPGRADTIVRGCHIHGSVVLADATPAGAVPVLLVDNDVVGDLLPAVMVGDTAMLSVAGDNILHAIDSTPASPQELTSVEVLNLLDRTIDLNAPVRCYDRSGELRGSYATIQAALDAAHHGERIVVGPGSYLEDLYISAGITLSGANAGLAGTSAQRGVETAVAGQVVVGCDVLDVTMDGLSIVGSITTERSAEAGQRLSVRNCVINGQDASAAIFLLAGRGVTISNNLIRGGADEAIYVPCGFYDLAITGNRICVADGAAAIALSGSAGADSAHIFGNVIVGGDYGVVVEVDSGLEQAGDVITIAGNQFGEVVDSVAKGAPAVAAIYADGPVPPALHRSLGASLELNTYNVSSGAVGVDVTFDLSKRSPRLPPGSVQR